MAGDAPVGVTRSASGEHERHLAVSAVAQQIAQVVSSLAMLAAITILARRLSLSEFGTYGLLLSLTAYLLFVQASVETTAVKAIAEAVDQPARDRAFSTAITLYTVAGLLSGGVIAGAGTAALGLFDIPAGLRHEAKVAVLVLGGLMAIGWPLKVFQDVLRGSQLFVASAVAESAAFVVVGGSLIALGLGGAPLWFLIATGAAVPLLTGAVSAAVMVLKKLPYRYRRETVTVESVRVFLGLSTYLLLTGVADLVIYSLDRAILAAFRSAAVVGLYEGPVRAHNLLQQLHSTLATPVVAVSARYAAERDVQRTRDLLLRGARYTLAAVVPVTIVFMILAKPILEVWLGAKFAVAATAMTVLAAYWLLNGSTGVPGRMLIAAGRARVLTVFAAAVALVNLAISLALTPSLGLNGVVLGTTLSYALAFPFAVRITLTTFPVRLADLVGEVWLPAYATGAVVAVALLALRLSVSLDTLPEVIAAGLVAMLAYWAIYYVVWLRAGERTLVKTVARAAIGR